MSTKQKRTENSISPMGREREKGMNKIQYERKPLVSNFIAQRERREE